MEINDVLSAIQCELKAPKGQLNKFGGYNYRSCEDILEALKPLLLKHKASLVVTDEIVPVANRIYVKATATLMCGGGNQISTIAYAREAETKKGMDEAQVTGASSSYARKYALNGLFAIDDTKDADTMKPENGNGNGARISDDQKNSILDQLAELSVEPKRFCSFMKVDTIDNILAADFGKAQQLLDAKRQKVTK